jgi:hypothetical protein
MRIFGIFGGIAKAICLDPVAGVGKIGIISSNTQIPALKPGNAGI